ncbi:MAG: hypothetical protein VX584_01965 [Actinomycetota bacterium]|nr:hypothetical protein [Actinomycetota bacterium]
MGMDVYGIKPENEDGEYFRRNVWWWRPLWTCIEYCAEDIASKVESPHTNDGTGLNAKDAKKLASALTEAIENGKVEEFIKEYDEFKEGLGMVDCRLCDATGIRDDEVGRKGGWHDKKLDEEIAKKVGREFGSCNGCGGLGQQEHSLASYATPEISCVQEFATFCENSGGFEIC